MSKQFLTQQQALEKIGRGGVVVVFVQDHG